MKKFLLFSAVLLASALGVKAQSVANSGFESWHDFTVQTGIISSIDLEAPGSWSGSDSLIAGISPFAAIAGIQITPVKQLSKSTDAHSGTYAASLKTAFLGDSVGNVPCVLINARVSVDIMALVGNPEVSDVFDLVTYSGGTPVLGRKVDAVNAWVKLTDQNQDDASAIVTALQKSQTGSGADTLIPIGAGSLIIQKGISNDYREISVPVVYADTGNTATDTLIVVFTSSAAADPNAPATNGNTLLVDDITMSTSDGSGTVSVRQPLLPGDALLVYPNPATDAVYFNLHTALEPGKYTLHITDISGRAVLFRPLREHINKQQVRGWAKGTYFYTLDGEGKFLKGKFVVR